MRVRELDARFSIVQTEAENNVAHGDLPTEGQCITDPEDVQLEDVVAGKVLPFSYRSSLPAYRLTP
ncbi:MAG: hypothetical protein OXD01_00640 [Gammaproteobacteria bacterium]|nr:hypothetical protein [Gammaproteobacteria bacterium]